MRASGVGAVTATALLAASVASAWASGTLQKAPDGVIQKAPSGTLQRAPATPRKAPPVAAPDVKVEAQSLTVTPSAPQAGQQVTVKFVFKNAGARTVSVPWSIQLSTGDQTLTAGTKTNLEPNATFEARATWTPTAGTHRLRAYVDPTGNLKNTAPVSAQIKDVTVVVAAAGATPVLATVTSSGVQGYSLRGTDLGLDRTTTLVFEGATQVPADRVTVFGPDHVAVSRAVEGTVAHKVVVRGVDSNVLSFTHPALPARAQPKTITVAQPGLTAVGRRGVTTSSPPVLSSVTSNSLQGYSLRGTDLGLDRTTTLVFEGATQVPADRVTVFGPDHVAVSRAVEGTVTHKVVVRGVDSNVLSFTHPALPPPAQPKTINVAPPGLTATGRRSQ